jgi:hypothetical protein
MTQAAALEGAVALSFVWQNADEGGDRSEKLPPVTVVGF